ncbi:MAG: ribonuclease P protein component [Actinomycetota bacterium]
MADAPSSSAVASRAGSRSLPRHGRPYVSLRPSHRFAAVFDTGESARVGGVKVIRAAGTDGPPQVGIVASRRVGNAVQRNRAKRRIREALRFAELLPDSAYVVVSSPSVSTTSFERLVQNLREAIVDVNKESR